MDNLKKLGCYFSEMVENSNTFGARWKNIPLGHQAFTLMKEGLPLRVKGEPRGMGFCFSYWSTKKAVLAKYGIRWNSPAVMNPRVMFD